MNFSLSMVYFMEKFFEPGRFVEDDTEEDHPENRERDDHVHYAQQSQNSENFRLGAQFIDLISNFQ